MKALGRQVIAECINCKCNFLNNYTILKKMFVDGLKYSNLSVISVTKAPISHKGIGIMAIISESHIVLQTQPDYNHVSIDIYTCSPESTKHMKLMSYLKQQLKPTTIRFVELTRGNPLEIIQKDWITSFSHYGLAVRYHIKKNILSKKSKYQQIDIIDNNSFGKMLFLDKEIQLAEKHIDAYTTSMVNPLIQNNCNLDKVVIIGGGDGAVLYELLKHKPKEVVVVDQDKEVVQACKRYLPALSRGSLAKKMVHIHFEDANRFLAEKNKSFSKSDNATNDINAIIVDLTMHPEAFTRQSRKKFFTALFKNASKSLHKNGMIALQCCSVNDKETKKLTHSLLSKYFKNIQFTKKFIPFYSEEWLFVSARKK